MRPVNTLKPRNARWRVSGKLSTPQTVVSIMTTALFLSGCATSRKAIVATEASVRQVSADSLQSEVRQTWTETVAQEEAKLEIPLSAVTNLPAEAEFRSTNGRASATVRHKGDTLVVYATCDSLQRQCVFYARQAASYRQALAQQKTEAQTANERRSYGVRALFIALTAGLATGILLTTLLTKTEIWRKKF